MHATENAKIDVRWWLAMATVRGRAERRQGEGAPSASSLAKESDKSFAMFYGGKYQQ